MSETAEILLKRIDARLAEMGKTRYWLAKDATDGRRTGLITDIARKGYLPKEPTLHRIAELLGVSVDWLMGRTAVPTAVSSEVTILSDRQTDFRGFPPPVERGIPLVGTGDCADLTVVDELGHEVLIDRSSFDPDYHVQYLVRPPALLGDHKAYAIYCHGNSMVPRFDPGDTVIVQPSRPPGPGDYVVVQLNDGNGDDVISVIVKKLVRSTPTYVELEQFNPATTFKIARKLVTRIHRIVRAEELMFR